MYLTNESNAEAYFDDFTVTIKEIMVVQNTDYYPFGLQHSTSWTRPTDLKNNFLYNAGSELNEMTQNYETFYRNYDPAIGRFNGVDIMATSHHSESPYSFAGNDPVYYNDPMGDTYNPGYYNPGHYRMDWLHQNGVATSFYNKGGGSSSSASGGAKWNMPEWEYRSTKSSGEDRYESFGGLLNAIVTDFNSVRQDIYTANSDGSVFGHNAEYFYHSDGILIVDHYDQLIRIEKTFPLHGLWLTDHLINEKVLH